MRLRAREAMRVPIAALDLEVILEQGEGVRTEVSAKFRRPVLEAELGAAGLRLEGWWTDPAGDYALALPRRCPRRTPRGTSTTDRFCALATGEGDT